MDNRLILCCLVFLFTLLPVTAQSIDSDNVIITSAEETYTFSLESGNPVLHVRLSTEYEATKAGERIQVATYYGKYITIDKASAGSLFNRLFLKTCFMMTQKYASLIFILIEKGKKRK